MTSKREKTIPPPPEGSGMHFRTILDDVRRKQQTHQEIDNNNDNKWTSSATMSTSDKTKNRIRTPLANRLSSSSASTPPPKPTKTTAEDQDAAAGDISSLSVTSPKKSLFASPSGSVSEKKNTSTKNNVSVPRLSRQKVQLLDSSSKSLANNNTNNQSRHRAEEDDDATTATVMTEDNNNNNILYPNTTSSTSITSKSTLIDTLIFKNNSLKNIGADDSAVISQTAARKRSDALMRSVIGGGDNTTNFNSSTQQAGSTSSLLTNSNNKHNKIAPWVPEKVSSLFFNLKKELSALSVEDQERRRYHQNHSNEQQEPSFDAIESCLQALRELSESSPVFQPILDLTASTLETNFQKSKNVIDHLSSFVHNNTDASLEAKRKHDSMTKSHYADLLAERKRTKDAQETIKRLQQEFLETEESWKIKIIDAKSDQKKAELELQAIQDEIHELREDRNALMSVRKSQEAHVREVEENAAKVIEDAERQVGIMKEDLVMKNKTIRELNSQMEGERLNAKQHFDDYASRALPPVKSAALRAEADRYKAEVKKLKERVDKLIAELQKREAYEPAVQWEDFVDEETLRKFCQVTEVPFLTKDERRKLLLAATGGSSSDSSSMGHHNHNNQNGKSSSTADAADENSLNDDLAGLDEEEQEEILNKVANRSAKFTQTLYELWKSTRATLLRYEAERSLFRKISQVYFNDVPGVNNVSIPLHLLNKLASPHSAAQQFQRQLLLSNTNSQTDEEKQEQNNNSTSSSSSQFSARLHLDCPPLDSSSPEPWIDPAWVGCFVQAPPNFNDNQQHNPSMSDAPVLCKAEHRFQIVNVVIPSCLMTINQVKSICVSALVLLGLNRVPERYEGWHPARHFAHAIRLQLDAAVQDVRNLTINPNQGNLPSAATAMAMGATFEKSFAASAAAGGGASLMNFNASLMMSGNNNASNSTSAANVLLEGSMNNNSNQHFNDYNAQEQLQIYADIQHHLRRRFVLPIQNWDTEIDDKSTTAACMTVLANRLQQFADQDPFLHLCQSFFLGQRPVLQHARYFALSLRSATQFFSRIEKMLKGSALGGSLPAPLFLQALKPAFSVADTTDLSRLALSVFHTHYWIQISENRKTQMDIICPGHEHVETEDEREEKKKQKELEERQKQNADNDDHDHERNNIKRKTNSTVGNNTNKGSSSILDQVLASVANAKKSGAQLQKEKEQLEGLPQYRSIEHWIASSDSQNQNGDENNNKNQQQQLKPGQVPFGEISYKKCFGTCWSKSGNGAGASPLLLQYASIYSNDVLHCEKLIQDDCFIGFAKDAVITRWKMKDVASAIRLWMMHFRVWKEKLLCQIPATVLEKRNRQQELQQQSLLVSNNNNNNKTNLKKESSATTGTMNLFEDDEEGWGEILTLEERGLLQQSVHDQQVKDRRNSLLHGANKKKRRKKGKGLNKTISRQTDASSNDDDDNHDNDDDHDDGDDVDSQHSGLDETMQLNATITKSSSTGVKMDSLFSPAPNSTLDDTFTQANPLSNHSATTRIVAFLCSAMFDPSEALNIETVCAHTPMRAQVSFEDILGVPQEASEPKIILNTNITATTPSLPPTLMMDDSNNTIATSELIRNIMQAAPWHPSLLLRVATGSWFLLESNSNLGLASGNPDHFVSSMVGCQELLNGEMWNAMNKVISSGPEVVGAGGKKKKKNVV